LYIAALDTSRRFLYLVRNNFWTMIYGINGITGITRPFLTCFFSNSNFSREDIYNAVKSTKGFFSLFLATKLHEVTRRKKEIF
jgi:hypothetical protein